MTKITLAAIKSANEPLLQDLTWFLSILGGLIAFAAAGGYITFRLMASR
jgi:lipid-A-disaccharide synthase-like uncharacterized protein